MAGVVCAFAAGLKFRWNYDDSLEVGGVHFVGVVLIGLLASEVMTAVPQDLVFGDGFVQLG